MDIDKARYEGRRRQYVQIQCNSMHADEMKVKSLLLQSHH